MQQLHALIPCTLAATLCASGASAKPIQKLNDTGENQCVSGENQWVDACAGTGQDGEFGRDATHDQDGNGHAGFHWVKVDATGQRLPAEATTWACIEDRVTGFLWQADSGGDPRTFYTDYGDGRAGDVSELVAKTNAAALCGVTNWRIPAVTELLGIVDLAPPGGGDSRADMPWFPDTNAYYHWTSDVDPADDQRVWALCFCGAAASNFSSRSTQNNARLVSGAPRHPPGRFTANGDEVADALTGLVWRRCVEGQVWSGTTCTGTASGYTWLGALDHAHEEAARTGVAWRVPNAKEISSLAYYKLRHAPYIFRKEFPGTVAGQRVWSSSAEWDSPDLAITWIDGGLATYPGRIAGAGVRLVRDGS